MTLLAVPNLGNPDRSLVDRIFRDDVTDAAGHLARALPQDIDHLVSFSVMSRQAHDQAVHLKPPRGISAAITDRPCLAIIAMSGHPWFHRSRTIHGLQATILRLAAGALAGRHVTPDRRH